jgi:hypothetical protein
VVLAKAASDSRRNAVTTGIRVPSVASHAIAQGRVIAATRSVTGATIAGRQSGMYVVIGAAIGQIGVAGGAVRQAGAPSVVEARERGRRRRPQSCD